MAVERGTLDQWADELSRVGAVAQDPRVMRALHTPVIGLQAKRQIIQSLAGPLSREPMSLVSILLERKRVELLPGLAEAFADRVREHQGIALAEVTTAVPLAEAERTYVAQRLASYIGRNVEVQTRVDPQIIGGVVARVGDQLIDASVRGKLELLKRRLQGTGYR
jgi:F-type H+-transporting ATPase subunit delta